MAAGNDDALLTPGLQWLNCCFNFISDELALPRTLTWIDCEFNPNLRLPRLLPPGLACLLCRFANADSPLPPLAHLPLEHLDTSTCQAASTARHPAALEWQQKAV